LATAFKGGETIAMAHRSEKKNAGGPFAAKASPLAAKSSPFRAK
jgi:hypothetical protein